MENLKYKTAIYKNSDWSAPSANGKIGLCLSGGGSRALSAGLGQLIGLKSLSDGKGGTMLDAIDTISSVSGGTWLTSIFSFSENRNLDDLLGVYTAPNTLTEKNIGNLSAGSIGHVPSRLSYSGMLDIAHKKLGFINILLYPEVRQWVWAVVVGELVLKPYGLYNGSISGTGKTTMPMPDRFFSYSEAYMERVIKALTGEDIANEQLTNKDFYFHQSNAPFPVINTNIKVDATLSTSALLPVQGTPVALGATGSATEESTTITADGGVESFAFASSLQSQTTTDALVNIERRYSLIDLVSCSSAFFAELVGQEIAKATSIFKAGIKNIEKDFEELLDVTEESILADLSGFVPKYNYWPVGEQAADNRMTGFADGGNLDNTGLLGMLARSKANTLVVCYNSEAPLGSKEDVAVEGYGKKIALVSSDIPILFGYQPKPVNGRYMKFSSSTPEDLKYLIAAQVFEPEEFGPLVRALFAASNGEQAATVARTKSLKVCDNPFAGISNHDCVDVLWLYNNYASDWVDDIHSNSWELADNIKIGRYLPGTDFYNFPNYNTASQIELNATQVNALAQFQAWVINQVSDEITDMLSSS